MLKFELRFLRIFAKLLLNIFPTHEIWSENKFKCGYLLLCCLTYISLLISNFGKSSGSQISLQLLIHDYVSM